MSQPAIDPVRWTVADLDLLPDNGNRYEIIDGELFAPQPLQIYRRQRGVLKLAYTALAEDEISSPMLPGFSCLVSTFFR